MLMMSGCEVGVRTGFLWQGNEDVDTHDVERGRGASDRGCGGVLVDFCGWRLTL